MLKKKNKSITKKKVKASKKKVAKKRKPISKKRAKTSKKKAIKEELIFQTKPEWIKSALASKAQYQKNILTQLKITMSFGKKKEKE